MKHLLPKSRSRTRGFTLLEMMAVVAIVAILAMVAAPNLRDFILKNRVKGAAEEAQSMLQFARSEAVKRQQDVFVNFKGGDGGTNWCFGAAIAADCDCSSAGNCVISIAGSNVEKSVTSAVYPDVTLTAPATPNSSVQFDTVRGLTTNNGTLTFTNGGFEIKVIIAPIGRVRICSPSDTSKKVRGYKDC